MKLITTTAIAMLTATVSFADSTAFPEELMAMHASGMSEGAMIEAAAAMGFDVEALGAYHDDIAAETAALAASRASLPEGTTFGPVEMVGYDNGQSAGPEGDAAAAAAASAGN